MSIYEYDEEKHMKAERKEHYELGYRAGEQRGFFTGQQQGIQAVILVGKNLGATKEAIAKQLEEQFPRLEQPAMEYVENYWVNGGER